MPRKASPRLKSSREKRAVCESIEFAEVKFAAPAVPRLAIRFSDGLSVLVENERAVPLAAAFLAEFRRHRKGGGR